MLGRLISASREPEPLAAMEYWIKRGFDSRKPTILSDMHMQSLHKTDGILSYRKTGFIAIGFFKVPVAINPVLLYTVN